MIPYLFTGVWPPASDFIESAVLLVALLTMHILTCLADDFYKDKEKASVK